jgi:ubiquinone/menaquinone biosynthesis C-methylase UbiE
MRVQVQHEIQEGLESMRSAGLSFTQEAYEMLPRLENPRILDVGCGPGTATLALARLSGGQVLGLDIDRAALEVLARRVAEEGLSEWVQVIQGSMLEMGFPDETFDVIWAEGSVQFMGFEKALRDWRRLIKPDGFLVVHEMAWLRPDPPQAIVDRWQPAFAEISTAAGYAEKLPGHGYRLTGHFCLPEEFWWVNWYEPVEKRIRALREKYAGDPAIQQILDGEQHEVDLYRQHARWYGSAFLVMQRGRAGSAAAG